MIPIIFIITIVFCTSMNIYKYIQFNKDQSNSFSQHRSLCSISSSTLDRVDVNVIIQNFTFDIMFTTILIYTALDRVNANIITQKSMY